MKRTLYMLLLLVGTTFLLASCTQNPERDRLQEQPDAPSYKIVEGHAPVWELATTQLLEMADAMPEEMYGYRPHDSVQTFAEQLVHIGTSCKSIASVFLKDVRPEGQPAIEPATMTKAEIRAMIQTGMSDAWDIIKTMSDDQLLNETCTSFSGNTMSRLEGLLFVQDHMSNHKSKANLYIRVSGNEPPPYRYY